MIGDTARQRTARRVLVAVLFGAAAAFFFGAPSNGYVTCTSTTGSTLSISLAASADNVTIGRNADGDFEVTSSPSQTTATSCGANIFDIEQVQVTVAGTDAGAQRVRID